MDLLHLSKGELKKQAFTSATSFVLLSGILCLQVQRHLKALCPSGNMSMMGKYRRNAITFKENVM